MINVSMKKVAVIILNWNGAKLLRRYLPTVIAGTDDSIADIIVADNGSTDDSLQVLEQEFPQVKVLKFDTNYGFALGYNLAIEQTMYPYTRRCTPILCCSTVTFAPRRVGSIPCWTIWKPTPRWVP